MSVPDPIADHSLRPCFRVATHGVHFDDDHLSGMLGQGRKADLPWKKLGLAPDITMKATV